MISDATPEAAQLVVLIEEAPPIGSDDHRWELTQTIPVDGDRAAAEARARKLAMEHLPRDLSTFDGATAGRSVFRTSDGSWLVEVRNHYKGVLFRFTTAEQVHAHEYIPPPLTTLEGTTSAASSDAVDGRLSSGWPLVSTTTAANAELVPTSSCIR